MEPSRNQDEKGVDQDRLNYFDPRGFRKIKVIEPVIIKSNQSFPITKN